MYCNICIDDDLEDLEFDNQLATAQLSSIHLYRYHNNQKSANIKKLNQGNKPQKISLKTRHHNSNNTLKRNSHPNWNSQKSIYYNRYPITQGPQTHTILSNNMNHLKPQYRPTYTPKNINNNIYNRPTPGIQISANIPYFQPIKRVIQQPRITFSRNTHQPYVSQNPLLKKQQTINSYCKNPTTVPSIIHEHQIQQNQKNNKNSFHSNPPEINIKINQISSNSKKSSILINDFRKEKISNSSQSQIIRQPFQGVFQSTCELRPSNYLSNKRQQKKSHQNLFKSQKNKKQLRELKDASINVLECKKTESVAQSQQSSERSIVLMSHQDFLSRNIINQQKRQQEFDNFNSLKHNVYVGKIQLLPRQSHL